MVAAGPTAVDLVLPLGSVTLGLALAHPQPRATYEGGSTVTNVQARLLASAIALLAGALAASTDNLNVNVGIAMILVGGAIFVAEYVRSQRQ